MRIYQMVDDMGLEGMLGNIHGSHPDTFKVVFVVFPAGGVVDDVIADSIQLRFIADDMIVKTRLPGKFEVSGLGAPT